MNLKTEVTREYSTSNFRKKWTFLNPWYADVRMFVFLKIWLLYFLATSFLRFASSPYYRWIDVIKPNDVLTMLNSIYNGIPSSIDLNDNKLPFLDNLITKTDEKSWLNIHSKPTDSRWCFLPFLNIQNPDLRI